jgi:hypothetical protein
VAKGISRRALRKQRCRRNFAVNENPLVVSGTDGSVRSEDLEVPDTVSGLGGRWHQLREMGVVSKHRDRSVIQTRKLDRHK